MGKVMAVPTQCSYLEWETFSTLEDEEMAIRSGKKPTKTSLEFSGDSLKVTEQGADFSTSKVEDLVRMQEVLKIRCTAHEMAGIVSAAVYQRFTDMYLAKLRQTVPDQMRKPTLNEVRMVDRLIHREALQRLARGQNSLEDTLLWFLSINGRAHIFWSFLDPQVASQPDQGVPSLTPKEPAYPPPIAAATSLPGKAGAPATGQGKCSVCGKTRAEHPQKLFCSTKGKKGDGKKFNRVPPPPQQAPPRYQQRDDGQKRRGDYRRDDRDHDQKKRR
jgi:hypothetical protein